MGDAALGTWRAFAGRRVTVFAPEGSFAARRAPAVLREADQAVLALERLLQPAAQPESAPVEVYLSDPMAGLPLAHEHAPDDGDGEHGHDLPVVTERGLAIVREVLPEAPGEPLAWPLAHLLVSRWYGEEVAEGVAFLDGIAGVVASRTGSGPSAVEADASVRASLDAGRSVSLRDVNPDDPAVTSFVSFLIEGYGEPALRAFLAAFDPTRRDQAALAAYQRPLGALEEAWLARVARGAGATGGATALVRRLAPMLRPHLRREAVAFVLMLLSLAYTLALPLAGKYLFDDVIPSHRTGRLVAFVLVVLGIYLAGALISTVRIFITSSIHQRVLVDLQGQMFERLQRLSHDFYGRSKVGDVISRFSTDILTVQNAFIQLFGLGLYQALTALAALITLFVLSPLLGLLVLAVVPLFTVGYVTLRARLRQASAVRQRLNGDMLAAAQENLSAHTVIKAFGMEDRATRSFRDRLDALYLAIMRLVRMTTVFDTSTAVATGLGQVIVFGVGGYLVIRGHISLGTLVAFVGLLPSLFQPVAALSSLGQTVQSASGSVERIAELLDEEPAIASKPGASALPRLSEDIRLDEVTFGYGDRTVLDGVSLRIPAGKQVAIVGPSGSGKSTIASLLLRFWDPERGAVRFDGIDLRDVTLESLRGQIGVVFQDTFVFDTTLRENIAIGRPGATDAEVARLGEYVEALPQGFDTVLGERGVRMSGGQRQRLAIARVLLRDPPVLILDEATSALDARTEREILDTLSDVTKGRTTITITHRLVMAANADRILVIDRGRCVEEGPHAELVRAGGLYQRLYEEQSGVPAAAPAPAELEQRMRVVPLFAGLPADALAALAGRLRLERFDAGQDVVRAGEPGDRLYVIGHGRAEVVLEQGGWERSVAVLDEGDYFGESALLTGEPRTATVRTAVPSDLYSLERGDFVGMLERDASLRRGVEETLAVRRDALAVLGAKLGVQAPA